MIGYRQLIDLINKRIKKYAVLHYAKEIVEKSTEKAQNKLFNAQNVASEKYNIVAKVSIIKYIIPRQKSLSRLTVFFYIDKRILNT